MTSSNGNTFRVTGPLCGEFTGPGEFPTQRPVTRSFDVFFDLRLNKDLSKQPWGWWFETPSWSLWRQCNEPTRGDMLHRMCVGNKSHTKKALQDDTTRINQMNYVGYLSERLLMYKGLVYIPGYWNVIMKLNKLAMHRMSHYYQPHSS